MKRPWKNTKLNKYQWLKAMSYSAFLKTDYWQMMRIGILKRDGYKCVVCHSKNNPNVHHLFYRPRGMEHKRDLLTLCRDCHHQEHILRFRDNCTRLKELLWKKNGKQLNNVDLYLSSLDSCPS